MENLASGNYLWEIGVPEVWLLFFSPKIFQTTENSDVHSVALYIGALTRALQ